MTFLPIVGRELRVQSRKRSTYWIRTGAALAVVVIGTWMFLMLQREPPKEISNVLFGLLTGTAVLYCLLAGVRSTADCLSQEKREGTLGLLFLTDLKGYDVVLGKLVATSVNGLYSVLAMVPMLAVPLLIGGITLEQFGRMALVAINTLFFSLSIGMYVSAFSRHPQKATMTTMLIILILSGVFPAAGAYLLYLGKKPMPTEWLFMPSPGFSYYLAWDAPFTARKMDFWHSLITIHVIGWVTLCLAAIVAPRSWQDRPSGVAKLRWRERWQLWSYGNLQERIRFRTRLLNANAFFWLAGRARLKPAYVWFVLGMLGCAWFYGWVKWRGEWLTYGIYIVTAIVLHLLIKGWFVSEVGRQLAEDRKSGALELLLSTSLTVRDIVQGQLLALARQFLAPVVVILSAEIVFLMAGLRDTELSDDRSMWIAGWIFWMIALVGDLAALFWVGMWQALTARNPSQAASSSLMQIIILPPAVFGIVCLFASLSMMQNHSDLGGKFFMAWWFGLGLAADLYFGLRARNRLFTQFRRVAADRYVPRPGFWKRVFTGEPHAEPESVRATRRVTYGQ